MMTQNTQKRFLPPDRARCAQVASGTHRLWRGLLVVLLLLAFVPPPAALADKPDEPYMTLDAQNRTVTLHLAFFLNVKNGKDWGFGNDGEADIFLFCQSDSKKDSKTDWNEKFPFKGRLRIDAYGKDHRRLKAIWYEQDTGSGNTYEYKDKGSTRVIEPKALNGVTITYPVVSDNDYGWKWLEVKFDVAQMAGNNESTIEELLAQTWRIYVESQFDRLDDGQTPSEQYVWAHAESSNGPSHLSPFGIRKPSFAGTSYSFVEDGGNVGFAYNFNLNGDANHILENTIPIALTDGVQTYESILPVSSGTGTLHAWANGEGVPNVDLTKAHLMKLHRSYSGCSRISAKTRLLPQYHWPDTLLASYASTGSVRLTWTVSAINADSCVKGDAFEIQRSTDPAFVDGKQIVTYTVPFDTGITDYAVTDDVSDLGEKQTAVYYRLRRTASADVWKWHKKVDTSITVENKLWHMENLWLDVESTDDYPVGVLHWTPVPGVWPDGMTLDVLQRNLTAAGPYITLASLSKEEAEKGEYRDESITSCNQFQYTLRLNTQKGYTRVDYVFGQKLLHFEIGQLRDLVVSKGYYADRVTLEWTSTGAFDKFRIRRVEHGTTDTTTVGIVDASGAERMQTADTNGEPGKYYTYIVDGFVSCNKKPYYSEDSLMDIGFRSPTGSVYGRVTFENGQAVPEVDVLLESDAPNDGRSLRFSGGTAKASDIHLPATGYTLQAYVRPQQKAGEVMRLGLAVIDFTAEGDIRFTDGTAAVSTPFVSAMNELFVQVTALRTPSALLLFLDGHLAAATEAPAATAQTGDAVLGTAFNGWIDEVRLWSAPLDTLTIRRDHNRQLYGGESGLTAYWRFNDGIDGQFYDLSHHDGRYNKHHGHFGAGVSYSDVIPTREQLCLKGITDSLGNYTVSGIPYTGQGTMYRITPRKGTHQFDPTQQQRLVGPGAASHTCDFTDNSSFPVMGTVYYDGTTVPVSDVMFYVDGALVMDGKGRMVTSGADGRFSINVPVGIHDVRAMKSNHTFVGEGRITNLDGTDRNYQHPLENVVLYDSTRVKLIGRVAGGPVQQQLALGHSLSRNNLGDDMTVELRLETQAPDLATTPHTDRVAHLHGKHSNTVRYDAKRITVMPDTETGEWEAWLIPERFQLSARVAGHGTIASGETIDLTTAFAELLTTHTDSVKVKGQLEARTDTVRYNYAYQAILRTQPQLEVVQCDRAGRSLAWFGDTVNVANSMTGEEIRVPVYDRLTDTYLFGTPVFRGAQKYRFGVSAFEEYVRYAADGLTAVSTDRVPVTDGVVQFNNALSSVAGIDTLSLDSLGRAEYAFEVGAPNTTDNNALKRLEVSLQAGGSTVQWGRTLDAIITGAVAQGQRFVTKGPNHLTLILRDPPGSNSYSYFEAGLTTSSTNMYTGSIEEEGSVFATAHNGGDIITFAGVGAGKITEIDVELENVLGATHQESVEWGIGTTETTTFITGYRTSDDPLYVGSAGDVFIGYATNISYGQSQTVQIIPRRLYNDTRHTILRETADYLLVRGQGIDIGMDYATAFAYPQAFIEGTLIPELQSLRNSVLQSSEMTEAEAQQLADATGEQVYLSRVESDDARFGADNCDRDVWTDAERAAYGDRLAHNNGPSYTIIVPTGKQLGQDTVKTFNEQISQWTQLLAQNEKEKVQARLKQNYSFHAGAPVSYAEEYASTRITNSSFNIGIGAVGQLMTGVKADGVGMTLTVEDVGYVNNGGEFSSESERSSKIGFELVDEGSTDYLSVDVCVVDITADEHYKTDLWQQATLQPAAGTDPLAGSRNFVFRTKGGATSCPFETEEYTRYYQPGRHLLNARTAQVEVPVIDAEKRTMTDVPSSRRAVYKLWLKNGSEIQSDCAYDLNVVHASNPDGAKFYVDGAPLAQGMSFVIPAGQTLTKTLEVEMGAALDYDDLQLVLHSQCQYNTLDFVDNIADTLHLSAHFVPSCSDVRVAEPGNNWTVNTDAQFVDGQGHCFLPVKVDNYDVNYRGFECVKVQYKPSAASDAEWVTAMTFYADSTRYREAQGEKQMLPEGGSFTYRLPMQTLPDGGYDLCAVSVCSNGILTASDVVSGVKDTKRPVLFGSPQPAGGILGIADEVMLRFNEAINEGLVTQQCFQVTGTRAGSILTRAASIRFDGEGSVLTTEARRCWNGHSFTMEASVLVDGPSAHDATILSHGNANSSFELALTPEHHLQVSVGESTLTSAAPVDFREGEWQHVAVAYDATDVDAPRVVAYWNLVEVLNADVPVYEAEGTLRMGQSFREGRGYAGKLSEVRLWNGVRTLSQLASVRGKSLQGNEVGLSAYYPLNEGRGTTAEDKARGANATLSAAQWFIDRQGYAARFDGQSYLSLHTGGIPVNAEQDFTLELWFRAAKGQRNATIIGNGCGDGTDHDAANTFSLGLDADGRLATAWSGLVMPVDGDWADEAWHHYALTVSRTAARAQVYVDGQLRKHTSLDGTQGGLSAPNFWIGARRYMERGNFDEAFRRTDRWFSGEVDEVRLWNVSKPQSLIASEMNESLAGSEVGLLAYYPFDRYVTHQGTQQMDFTLADQAVHQGGLTVSDAEPTGNVARTSESAPVKDRGAVEAVMVNCTVNGDALILTPAAATGWDDFEQTVMTFRAQGIHDLHGNAMANPVVWTAFIDRGQLRWADAELAREKMDGEPLTFTADIVNKGGAVEHFTIEGQPSWLKVSPARGTIGPKQTLHLTLEVDEALNIGQYDETLYVMNDNGLASALPLSMKVRGVRPDWTVRPADFRYSMNLLGQMRINGLYATDADDRLAAFSGGRCVGVAAPVRKDGMDQTFEFLTVYANEPTSARPLEFRIWDESTGRIYLATPSDTAASRFANGAVVGTPDAPVTFDAREMRVRQLALSEGWNWVSLNLASPQLPDVNATLSDGQWTAADEVKNQHGTMSWSERRGQWVGASSLEFDNVGLFLLHSSVPQLLSISGIEADARQTPVGIHGGWNYVGFLPQVNMTLTEALADYASLSGDVVKSASQFAVYSNRHGWVGNLQQLRPGEGYMLHRQADAADTVSFRYPSTRGTRAAMQLRTLSAGNTPWQQTASVVARLEGFTLTDGQRLVALGADGRVHGTAEAVGFAADARPLQFITLGLDGTTAADARFGFAIEDADGQTVAVSTTTLALAANALSGTPDAPTVIRFAAVTEGVDVTPQLVASHIDVAVGTADAGVTDATWTIYDAAGRTVLAGRIPLVGGQGRQRIDASRLNAGAYVIHVEAGSVKRDVKLVKMP